jgi:hypothetical protein
MQEMDANLAEMKADRKAYQQKVDADREAFNEKMDSIIATITMSCHYPMETFIKTMESNTEE